MTYQPSHLLGLFREILSSGGLPTYMLSAVIPTERSYSALLLAKQLIHQFNLLRKVDESLLSFAPQISNSRSLWVAANGSTTRSKFLGVPHRKRRRRALTLVNKLLSDFLSSHSMNHLIYNLLTPFDKPSTYAVAGAGSLTQGISSINKKKSQPNLIL